MKTKVLIPSEEYKSYAGARIRYGRLGPELARVGIELALEDISEFAPESDASDALLISKCHDARAFIAAAAGQARGQLVGVDLFDDYFSQVADSRLNRYRSWLNQLLPRCDFAICSTPAIASVVESFDQKLPIHVVNDPAPPVRVDELSETLKRKLANTTNECTLRLAWFGVGDNPQFKVGLSDLAAYGGILRPLRKSGMAVELRILTNIRALTVDGLALIEQLPVRTIVEEWTEEREKQILSEAFACFLPVNGQRFSAAKSLNRAVTALSGGCQVISAGYPLYAPLGDLIYTDIDSFAVDLAKRSMRHSAASGQRYQSILDSIASPAGEAVGLRDFLKDLKPRGAGDLGKLALIHGQNTNDASHKAVRALEGLSVASPYCVAEFDFDVIFRAAPSRLVMLVSDDAAKRLPSAVRESLRPWRRGSGRRLHIVPDEKRSNQFLASDVPVCDELPLPVQLATYGATMALMRERLQRAFGPCRVFISESSAVPFNPGF